MRRKCMFVLFSFLFLVLSGCHSDAKIENEDNNNNRENIQQENNDETEIVQENIQPVEIELYDYGIEKGLQLEAPSKEVATNFTINGTIEHADEFTENYVWVIVRKKEAIEEISNREIEYYIPIDDQAQFSQLINLPNGEGDYQVKVRLPSTDRDNYYYDSAIFNITNLDSTIARDIEYLTYGLERGLQFDETIKGFNVATEFFNIEGIVGKNYNRSAIIAEIKKDGEKSIVGVPVNNGTFKGEIPLFYGEGTHEILFSLYTDDESDHEGTYYHAAELYVQNDSTTLFPEITQYGSYIDRGIRIDQFSWNMETESHSIEYPISGTIDRTAPLADSVSHVIVKLQHLDDRKDVATYYFPVEDYRFNGITHFRFGPGEYKVTIYVPDVEQKIKNEFHFTTALEYTHEVKGIEDQRDILPSRGVESDSPIIIEKAKEITDGVTTKREQAKEIFKFVAKHVSYDVQKFKEDIFHPDDSAIATLELGSGICQDYTFLTLALLRSIGIESRYVEGFAGGRHAWVEANIDGEWIEMDPTWGAGYVDGNEFHFQYNEDFFDPDPEFLKKTHTRSGLLY